MNNLKIEESKPISQTLIVSLIIGDFSFFCQDLWAHGNNKLLQQESKASGLEITLDADKTTFIAKQIPSRVVLEKLEKRSGIHFKVSEEVKKKLVTINLSKSNWAEITQNILCDYDTVDFWESKDVLSRVWVLRENKFIETSPQNLTQQLIENYQVLIRIPPGIKIPEKIFDKPDIRNFLKIQGIEKPEHWRDVLLAGVARRQAERNLNALRYVERKKNKAEQWQKRKDMNSTTEKTP